MTIEQESLRKRRDILRKSLTEIPQLRSFNELDGTFPQFKLSDLRDIIAFRLLEEVVPLAYETAFARTDLRENRRDDLWIVLYIKRLKVGQEEVFFGRLNINCIRRGILGDFQTILDFRRLGNRYLLKLTSNKLDHEINISDILAEQYGGYGELLGVLENISTSLDDSFARDFMIVALNNVVSSQLKNKA